MENIVKNITTEKLIQVKAEAIATLFNLEQSINDGTAPLSIRADISDLKAIIRELDERIKESRKKNMYVLLENLFLETKGNTNMGKYHLTLTPAEMERIAIAIYAYIAMDEEEELNLDFFERPLLEDLEFVPNEKTVEDEKEKERLKKEEKFERENLKNIRVQKMENVVRLMQFHNEEIREEVVAKQAKVSINLVRRYLKYFA